MPSVRPSELPAASSVTPGSAIIVDNGSVVQKGTPLQLVDSARPLASQGEAEAGIDNTKIMSSLRVNQAVSAQVFTPLAASNGANFMGFSFSQSYGDGSSGKAMQGIRSVLAAPYNAVANNVADDSAAIAAAAADGVLWTPDKSVKMNTALAGDFRAISVGTEFTGPGALDSAYPAFGSGVLKLISRGAFSNCFIGIADNDATATTHTFPTAVTGHGVMRGNGNTVFGIYAEAVTYAATGCPTNEIDTFNRGGVPSGNLPPDRTIGTVQQVPIGLTVGADGDYDSAIGIHICQGGQTPQKWLTGLYIGQDSCVNFGLFIDALATSTHTSAVIRHASSRVGLRLQGVGAPDALASALVYTDGAGVDRFALKQDGSFLITGDITQLTVGIGGTAAALPAAPYSYIKINIDGFNKLIPCYNSP